MTALSSEQEMSGADWMWCSTVLQLVQIALKKNYENTSTLF